MRGILWYDEVYRPSEDTYLLLRAALAEVRPEDAVLEVGSGSGYISRHLKARARSVLATDINPYAALMTRAEGVETVRADLFSGLKGRFDLIIFNPPYLPTTMEERTMSWMERALDGGESGRETISRFLEGLKDHLNPEGRALLVVSSLTGPKEVLEKAASEGLSAEPVAEERLFFEQLYVLRLDLAQEASRGSRRLGHRPLTGLI
ncbi:MAG: class I SAM-dependent methyltransferase [Methanothrix sp.]|nr:class I SAM-dependent methyltransferase [Methanothrix sp.]